MAIGVLLVIIAGGIGVAIGLSRRSKINEDVKAGKILKRTNSYWERRFIYALSGADFDTLFPAMKKAANVSGTAISEISWSKANSRFQFLGSYNAAMVRQDDAGEKNVWEFRFTHFKTSNGIPETVNAMNILLTAIEKELLAIDPATTVLDLHNELKSHTNFF